MKSNHYSSTYPAINSELDELLHPARAFKHPRDVVHDRDLTVNEKRAILASWASDACAVEAVPALRRPPDTGQIVSVDEILAALRALDRLAQTPEAAWARRRELLSGFRRRMREPGSGSDLAR
jgi:hypothetical protein